MADSVERTDVPLEGKSEPQISSVEQVDEKKVESKAPIPSVEKVDEKKVGLEVPIPPVEKVDEKKVESKAPVPTAEEKKAEPTICEYVYSNGRKHGQTKTVKKDSNGNYRCPLHAGKTGAADEKDDIEELLDGLVSMREFMLDQVKALHIQVAILNDRVDVLDQTTKKTKASLRTSASLTRALRTPTELLKA